jgi:hypothetical protein
MNHAAVLLHEQVPQPAARTPALYSAGISTGVMLSARKPVSLQYQHTSLTSWNTLEQGATTSDKAVAQRQHSKRQLLLQHGAAARFQVPRHSVTRYTTLMQAMLPT